MPADEQHRDITHRDESLWERRDVISDKEASRVMHTGRRVRRTGITSERKETCLVDELEELGLPGSTGYTTYTILQE